MANAEQLSKLNEGVEVWKTWRKEKGIIKPDLREAILQGAKLQGTGLSGAYLQGAALPRANLRGANLSNAHLSGADLEGADLTDTDVTDLSYLEPAPAPPQFRERPRNLIPYRKQVMRGRYQGVRGLASCYGNKVFVRDAADQDYLDTIEAQLHSWWERFGFGVRGLTDYGRSFRSVVVIALIFVFSFGSAYSHWPQMLTVGDRCPTTFTPYYFSIVTYTTLGFGDVKPHDLYGEILVSIEVILGYITLGLLLAVLGDKVARRS